MVRAVLIWLFTVAASTVMSPAALSQATDDNAAIERTDQEVAVDPNARDDQIERRLVEILAATGWFGAVGVDVSKGVVFLDGRTSSKERRAWAGDLAAKTQDVVAVVNRIEVDRKIDWSFTPATTALQELTQDAIAALPFLLFALLILPAAWFLSSLGARFVRWAVGTRVQSSFLTSVIARAASIPIFLLGLYMVLQVAGLTNLAVSLIGGAGVIGIVVGFAFRDIAENFLASLLLSVRQPFRRGDYIEVEGRQGTVENMNTRSTVLVSLEGNHIQIPNSVIFKSTIINYTAAPARRDQLDVGIGYDVAIADAQAIILDVLTRHEAVLPEPATMVLVDSLGASTVNIRAYYWVDGQNFSVLKVRSALLRLVKGALIDAGISMPDDAREVIFPEGIPLAAPEGAEQREHRPGALDRRRVEEPGETATIAEGDLGNEVREIEGQAAAELGTETRNNLLKDEPERA